MVFYFGAFFLVGTLMSMASARRNCPPVCTLENAPVCGTDGVTYGNLCFFECERGEGTTIAYKGDCRPKKPLCFCTIELNPVCGTDGQSYDNPCQLNCAKKVTKDLNIYHWGRCMTKKR